jgi:hypothetical protein
LGAICTLLVLTSIEPDLFQNWISRFASHFRDIANATAFVQTKINRLPTD